MLPWVMQVGFYISCTVLGKWNVSRVIPRLYGWVYKILRLFTFVFDHSVVVVTAGSLSWRAQTESYEYPCDSHFMKFVLRISGSHKILKLSWGLRHWQSEFNYHEDWILISFSVKTDKGEVESTVLLIFVLWWCFNRKSMKGSTARQKVLFRAAEIACFSSRDFGRSNKHDAFWHVASTGYFSVLFLWAITVSDFVPLKIYKNLDLPLSAITFTVNHQAYNHFCKYIYLFQIL